MAQEVKTARNERIQQLKAVEEDRESLLEKRIFSTGYKFQVEGRMREIFPYYFKESVVPAEFRRSFLSVMDSTIKEFTHIYEVHSKSNLLIE